MTTKPGVTDAVSGDVAAALKHRWATALGVAFAVAIAYDLSGGAGLSFVVGLAALVYVAAAALGRRWMAWVAFAVAFAGVITMELLGIEPWLGLVGTAVVFLIGGALRGLLRPGSALTVQALGMLGFGGIAVAALYTNPTLGGYLVAAGLIGHGVWDVVHHRRDIVVSRSYAEFCAVIDFMLGAAILLLT